MILQILTIAALVQFVAFLVVTGLKKRQYTKPNKKTIYRFKTEIAESLKQTYTAEEPIMAQIPNEVTATQLA